MNPTSNPEPKRKSNQYPGGHLPTEQLVDSRISLPTAHPWLSNGKTALMDSVRSALNGIQYVNQISCLRGQLRKAVIKLAEDVAATNDLNMPPPEREKRRNAAITRFVAVLEGFRIVPEDQAGQTVWRLRREL